MLVQVVFPRVWGICPTPGAPLGSMKANFSPERRLKWSGEATLTSDYVQRRHKDVRILGLAHQLSSERLRVLGVRDGKDDDSPLRQAQGIHQGIQPPTTECVRKSGSHAPNGLFGIHGGTCLTSPSCGQARSACQKPRGRP